MASGALVLIWSLWTYGLSKSARIVRRKGLDKDGGAATKAEVAGDIPPRAQRYLCTNGMNCLPTNPLLLWRA